MTTSLRDQLTAALAAKADDAELPATGGDSPPVESVADPAPTEPAAESVAETDAAPAPDSEEKEAELPPLNPPSSWKKDYHEHWRTLPRAVQEYALEREGQYASGVSQYKQRAEKLAWAEQVEQEFGEDLRRSNMDAPSAVRQLMGIHRQLTSPDLTHRRRVIYDIARSVGVEIGGEPPPPPTAAEQAMFATQAQLQAWMQQQKDREAMEQSLAEIESFRATAPWFDLVREEMARLIQAGVAGSLQEAYDKATWIIPAVRDKVLSEQVSASSKRAPTAAQRAAAVAPKSSPSTAAAESVASGKDLRSSLVENFRRVTSDRV